MNFKDNCEVFTKFVSHVYIRHVSTKAISRSRPSNTSVINDRRQVNGRWDFFIKQPVVAPEISSFQLCPGTRSRHLQILLILLSFCDCIALCEHSEFPSILHILKLNLPTGWTVPFIGWPEERSRNEGRKYIPSKGNPIRNVIVRKAMYILTQSNRNKVALMPLSGSCHGLISGYIGAETLEAIRRGFLREY